MKNSWIWYSLTRFQEQVTLKQMHSSKRVHPRVLFFCQYTEDWWARCWNSLNPGKERQVISTIEVFCCPGPHPIVIWVTCETEHGSDSNTLSLQILPSCNYPSVSNPKLSFPTALLIPVMLWQWNSKGHLCPHRASALLWAAFRKESCYSFLLSLHMLSASSWQHPRKSVPIRVWHSLPQMLCINSLTTHLQTFLANFLNSSGWPQARCLLQTSFF